MLTQGCITFRKAKYVLICKEEEKHVIPVAQLVVVTRVSHEIDGHSLCNNGVIYIHLVLLNCP